MFKIRSVTVLFMMLGLLLSSGCSKAQSVPSEKILIVYLSRTSNTKAVADIIHKNVGGELVGLELEKPYPEEYQANVEQVKKDLETGFMPPLKTKIDSIDKYDLIFIGFPTWSMELPPPMQSFLKQYDLSGKTIVPFNTNAGYGIGSSFKTIKRLCPDSKVIKGFSTKGGKEKDGIMFVMKDKKEVVVRAEVKTWLQELGLVN